LSPETQKLRALIQKHEGLRLKPYLCSEGRSTIGYGRCLETTGITEKEAEYLLDNDIMRVYGECHKAYGWLGELNQARKAAILSMAFNVGVAGVGKFWRMCAALGVGDYGTAAHEMRSSLWAKQVGRRATELSLMMERGNYVSEKEIDEWIRNNG